jgi:hypothetical protein
VTTGSKTLFLILAENAEDQARFLRELPNDESCNLEVAPSLRIVIEKILAGGIDGLIMSLNIFDVQTLKTISKLRTFSPHLSMIITGVRAFGGSRTT